MTTYEDVALNLTKKLSAQHWKNKADCIVTTCPFAR
jgi:heterodisulfide reductase subunit B